MNGAFSLIARRVLNEVASTQQLLVVLSSHFRWYLSLLLGFYYHHTKEVLVLHTGTCTSYVHNTPKKFQFLCGLWCLGDVFCFPLIILRAAIITRG